MSRRVSWFDQLRIEAVVWTLDGRLYELPRRTRIGIRREVRTDLRRAIAEVGAGTAIRNLGNLEQLAGEYVNAEYGDHGPRPLLFRSMWVAALLPFVVMVLLSFLTDATNAYAQGIADADPHATGTYTWSGLHLVQSRVTYTFVDGHATWVGGAFTPLVYVLLLAVLIVLGKLWRFPTYWRQWRAAVRRARVQQPA